MQYDGVIFDMDGVVFDSESLWRMGFVEGNKIFHVNLTEQFRWSICGKSESLIRDEIRAIYPELDVDAYRDYMIDLVASKVKAGEFDIKPHFLDLVTYLKDKGYKIALATSSFSERARSMFAVKGLDIDEIFDAYSFLEDVGARSKPDPYIFKITADKMGVDYTRCVVLEDSINGIHAAVAGGMAPVHVFDIIPPDDYCKEHCIATLSSLNEVKEII